MKNAVKRSQLGYKVEGKPFRFFNSITDSIKDQLIYFDYVGFPEYVSDVAEYTRELKNRSYFEEPYSLYLSLMEKYI